MDLFTIDPTTLNTSNVIDGYHSLIWTERFMAESEFSIISYDIDGMRAKLPVDSILGQTSTTRVMCVETHAIEQDEDGAPILIVSGRGLESPLLENRVSIDNLDAEYTVGTDGDVQQTWVSPTDSAPLVAAYVAVVLLMNTGPSGFDEYPGITVEWYPEAGAPIATYQFPRQDMYQTITEILYAGNYTVQAVSYVNSSKKRVIALQFTKGKDRTSDIIFSTAEGHFDQPQYLWSHKGYKNVAYVSGHYAFRVVHSPDLNGAEAVGFNRRILYVDASDIQDPDSAETQNLLQARGITELAKNRATVAFSGTVNASSPYKYGYDNFNHSGVPYYNVGDLVTVSADYGLKQTMLVSEYIFTEDASGDTGTPTLVPVP